MSDIKWTIVQHSGYGWGGKEQFIGGLETDHITTEKQLEKVLKAGGVVFDSYGEADDYSFFAMYKDNPTLIPWADRFGEFVPRKNGSLALFIPQEQNLIDFKESSR